MMPNQPVGPDGSGGPHVFVPDLEDPHLDGADRHHLERVVRLRSGDPLTISNGRGEWRPARFGDVIEATGPTVTVARPRQPITVAFALIKGARVDEVTRHLTELGVDAIVPFTAARSVVRLDHAGAVARHERLVKISVEAAMQCRRVWLPTVHPIATFAQAAALEGAVLAQRGGPELTSATHCVLVGPEGGWTEEEVASRPTVSIGEHVLRAETAALTAGVLLARMRRADR